MRDREDPPLFCPACQTVEMRRSGSVDSDLIIDRCTGCQGLWFDGGEVRQFLNSDSFKERFLNRQNKELGVAGEDDSRSCPRCGCALQKLELAGIVVDLCVSCLGVWFDLGELEKLVKAGREGRLEDDDSLLAHEIREGLDGRDIPPDLLGHLVATIKSFFTSLG